MADKHIKLGTEGTELLNMAKAKMITLNPLEKITDEITVKKALKEYLEE